jgi:hypothetical protein
MGEVVYVDGGALEDEHLVCINPTWLCHTILGTILCHDRFDYKRPSGTYTSHELQLLFADSCADTDQLKRILCALGLCCESGDSGKALEFPALNLVHVADAYEMLEKHEPEPSVYNGLQVRCTSLVKTLIACMWPRLQAGLRRLVNRSQLDLNNNIGHLARAASIDKLVSCCHDEPQKTAIPQEPLSRFASRLYDVDLVQWRYGSKMQRHDLECLVTLDTEGRYVEIKARAPASQREQLFYFVQDMQSFVEQSLAESLPGKDS